ncbi:hypothetical protein HY374_02475 [Candidatus Berkelbacteria bacterium]|nr:hypothetical protein [Candidatus Berkelbacteria bacterium]
MLTTEIISETTPDVANAWAYALLAALAPGMSLARVGATMSQQLLVQSRYVEHFPENICPLPGQGDSVYTPAACLQLFGQLAGTDVPENSVFGIVGTCRRSENGRWAPPYRLKEFDVLELVVFGSAVTVRSRLQRWEVAFGTFMELIGLGGTFIGADDSFAFGQSPNARLYQRLMRSKREYRVKVSDGTMVALASRNDHGYSLADRFGLHPHASGCFAVGLSRVAAFAHERGVLLPTVD